MENIYGLTRKKLEEALLAVGEKSFRATQIFEWLYKKQVSSFSLMTNISASSQEILAKAFLVKGIKLVKKQVSIDKTRKYLFELDDKEHIEAVLMHHDYGVSVCVSSQVGCNMGCKFCASGKYGKVRDLQTWEMVSEVIAIVNDLRDDDIRLSHVVIMGIGEPFENYDNVLDFIRIINDAKGLEIGSRHITVSTCGIVPKIYDFANFELQVNLALSLHFPLNDLRSKYMPINKAYPIEQVVDALKYYFDKTSRRVTFEYILLDGINDTKECADQLINLIKGTMGYVNLIPYNETNKNDKYHRSSGNRVHAFLDMLTKGGVTATIRKEFGSDIDAACGQLKAKSEGLYGEQE